jgi:hypothetical protein
MRSLVRVLVPPSFPSAERARGLPSLAVQQGPEHHRMVTQCCGAHGKIPSQDWYLESGAVRGALLASTVRR